jgi:hypothetical protein
MLPVWIFLQKEVGTEGYFLHPVRNDAPVLSAGLGPGIIPAGLAAVLEFLMGVHPLGQANPRL